jgi:subtilisin family serine protease
MRLRVALVSAAVLALFVAPIAGRTAERDVTSGRASSTIERALPKGFVPAVAREQNRLQRWFVVMRAPSVSQRAPLAGRSRQHAMARSTMASQAGAIREARSLGGQVLFRYRVLVNAFSVHLSTAGARQLARRSDVSSVQPVSIVHQENESSVPFIGATRVWKKFGVEGQGMTLALVDTGIDYTHKDFGGAGTKAAYNKNDPTIIEPGTFPTKKVIGGWDFVGENYDVVDDDPTNDTPVPDPDPLDHDGHGSHTGGTCCGIGVPGKVGPGVAPKAKILSYKVWWDGNSTADVLVAAFERAVDPNDDGSTKDHPDVLSFSGGVDYGPGSSLEGVAAQHVVDVGTVFVASAGNSNNQPAGGPAYILGTPASARGVIAVAASVDQYPAAHLVVNSPTIELPQNGLMFVQDWSAALPDAGLTADLFDGRAVDAADPVPTARMFCDPLPADSLTGKVVLVYKGSTGSGDCAGSDKVGNAAAAGAIAVVLVSIFPSELPTVLAGDQRDIPVVMIGRKDGDAILAVVSPNAPTTYNEGTVNATLDPTSVNFAEFADSIVDFSSEGPARITSDLKPDVAAPGFSIHSAAVGTGDEGIDLSGTSMAAPHVSGVAVLMRQLHPSWTPAQIKAVIMNQATRNVKSALLASPVPATVMGAGRVRAFQSATATTVARPGSLSFGLQSLAAPTPLTRGFTVQNFGKQRADYEVSGKVRYSDFDPSIADVQVSLDGTTFAASQSFSLEPGKRQRVTVQLTLDPTVVGPERELGDFFFNSTVDGTITVHQTGPKKDFVRVAWGAVPIAAADTSVAPTSLDLRSGPGQLVVSPGGAGTSFADLYLLGASDGADSGGEEDITAIGARSFTGPTIDGVGEGMPDGTDELAGIDWPTFLTQADTPTEPVEFAVHTASVHNTTDTEEIDVAIDTGADGVFADQDLKADYLLVKLPAAGGVVCLFDLSLASPFDSCAKAYFADYSNYNADTFGLVVDAAALGLTTNAPEFSYQVTACTGVFSGDVPAQVCDTAGDFDGTTYSAQLNAVDPALHISPLVCGGYWSTATCDVDHPVNVSVGSAEAGDNPSILVLFPNNAPGDTSTIVTTQT